MENRGLGRRDWSEYWPIFLSMSAFHILNTQGGSRYYNEHQCPILQIDVTGLRLEYESIFWGWKKLDQTTFVCFDKIDPSRIKKICYHPYRKFI